MRELGLLDADEGLSTTFEDVEAIAGSCRFSDCHHGNEPGCAVREALESGELDGGRWKSFASCRRSCATSSSRTALTRAKPTCAGGSRSSRRSAPATN